MPHLRTLDVSGVGYPMHLPDSMSDHTMPRLLSLKLGPTVFLTRIQAVSSVTSLELHVPPDCRRLFLLFPCVQKVILHRVWSTTLLPPELPRSILSMGLCFTEWEHQDHSEQIQSLGWRLVPIMRLESTSVSRPLEWFTAQTGHSLSMILSLRSTTRWAVEMMVNAADQATLQVFVPYDTFGSVWSWDNQGHWTVRLTELIVDDLTRLLPILVKRVQALPSLRSFTLLMRSGLDSVGRWLMSWEDSISLPVLQELVLAYSAVPNTEDVIRFVQTLPVFLFWGDRRLETLHVVGPGIAQLRQNDLSFVSTLCETLRLDNGNIAQSRSVSTSA
ncbi:hypothetical protein EXIGLDRAFT_781435 [Exidia glandulosa HHB12029]|uniref:F-box domain-containing protein n=1 Tax=Exidia glandulosa HHB12029 TaxID=1314781 RepID=A0A165B8V0_EXIGL|nr:hypothetical protein EXIGLDRAFT_781435 [Exidia glandulosa HHB12029]